ncbi:MAG: VOC family protein [Pseudomonadota bacterium]
MIRDLPVRHYGYAVANIEEAAHTWTTLFGAGPFFMMGNVEFDFLSHPGGDCTFVHSVAFGQWGSIAIELMNVEACSPPAVAERLIPGPMPVLNHVSYFASDPDEENERLEKLGAELYLRARSGPIDARMFDARKLIGCSIEVHRQSDAIAGFFEEVRRSSVGWNGDNPLRMAQPPV